MATLNTQVKGAQIKEAFAGGGLTITSGIIAVDINTENLSSLCDGSKTGFNLAYTPRENSLQVFLNGLCQEEGLGKDYNTTLGSFVTLSGAPPSDDVLIFHYWIAGAAGPGPTLDDRGIFAGGRDIAAVTNFIDYITIASIGDATDFGDLTVARRLNGATSNGGTDRGIFSGGDVVVNVNVIDYATISSTGDATDFGDLTSNKQPAATSNGTNDRGVFGGGSAPNVIEHITISTPSDATDFGDLTVANRVYLSATSNTTNERGVFAGGSGKNVIDYITISSAGDATDFGDLTENKNYMGATSNATNERGVFGAGYTPPKNTIEYITISSTGDATDFGDLTSVDKYAISATSNGTDERGVFGGGYNAGSRYNIIDYVTINSTGNSSDFGDLAVTRSALAATSNA